MNWVSTANIWFYPINIASGNGVFLVCDPYGGLKISTNCVDWTGLGDDFPFYKIIFDHGIFLASGYGGIWVSTDGVNWLPTDASNTYPVGVAWCNGLFVAVGPTDPASDVLISRNAIDWSETSSGPTSEFVSVAHGNNVFVAVSNDGTIMTSADGARWLQQSLNTIIDPTQITYGNGKFVIVGDFGSAVSSDGIRWSVYQSYSAFYNSVGYGNGFFVAGGEFGGVWISRNGTNWTQTDSTIPRLFSITYGKGIYVGVGDSFWNGSQWINTVVASHDGTNWIQTSSLPGRGLFGVTYGGSKFVAVGTDGQMLYSSNGFDWHANSVVTGDWLYDVCYGDGFYVAVGNFGGPYQAPVLISRDGVNWSWRYPHTYLHFNSVAFGNQNCVIVGTRGWIMESSIFP
jgi:hypothetical protein